ncbi:MAG: DUF4386 domain-containing protein [Candidatus Thorarchaeota archaeon]|nr:DUF4386 domain-containing protein [Candidatus Thorarchaeota archaeon]
MDSDNKNARIAGISFLISYLGLIVGNIIMEPIIAAPVDLANVEPNAVQLGIGILLESINGIAVIGIAVMMYTILKRVNEGVALGYLGFRGVEGFLSILGSTKAASLIELSHAYNQAGPSAYFDTLSELILADRHWTMEMLTVFFLLGALVFYLLVYKSEIMPRYVALWGFIAVALMTAMNVLVYLGIDLGFVFLIFALPIIANEFFVAIWLIVKGVNTSALPPSST